MPTEADIVWSLKKHLLLHGLGPRRWQVSDIAVDSDGSYRQSRHAADLEPMLSMPIRGFHPDLVCAYDHPEEEGLAAFEVKGRFDDWLKGLTQARAYREGVHRAYIALPGDKPQRLSMLERDANESGVGVWLLCGKRWEERVPSAPPRPCVSETRHLASALRGVALSRRLQLNHPLNYLAVAWARFRQPDEPVMKALTDGWDALRSSGSRRHAINGAKYLGLLMQDDELSRLGLTVCDLMASLDFETSHRIKRRSRFCEEAPGLAAVCRLVFFHQESTKLIIEALTRRNNQPLNTEELLRAAVQVNAPLATGLFLTDPRAVEQQTIPSVAFSPSFVFQFKQSLWHAGILTTSIHSSAGKGAAEYRHRTDMWQIEDRIFQGNGGSYGL